MPSRGPKALTRILSRHAGRLGSRGSLPSRGYPSFMSPLPSSPGTNPAFFQPYAPGRGHQAGQRRVVTCAEKWSGSPGSLPSRGPHGSGRADFPHPALRDTASLRACYPFKLR